MKKYGNYYRYNLALNDEENKIFLLLQNNKIGVKKIFMQGMDELSKSIREEVLIGKEEEI